MISKLPPVAILCAFMAALLEAMGFRSKRLFVALSLLMLMISAMDSLFGIIEPLGRLAAEVGISEPADKAFRALGLGYLFGFASEICHSLGEGGLATVLTIAGRVEIFLLILPYFVKTVELGLELFL